MTASILKKKITRVKNSIISDPNEFILTSGEEVKTWIYVLINDRTRRFFLGQSKFSRKEERHKDPAYTKLFSDWGKDGYSTYWFGVKQSGVIDTKIHPKIRALKDCDYNKNECFSLNGYSIDRIVDTCKKLIEGTFGKPKTDQKQLLKLRGYQKNFLKKINSDWEQWKDFLLFAKCRAGKTVMTFSYILERNYKVTLGVSLRTSPKQSWIEDLKKFIDFENIRVVDLTKKNWENELRFYLNEPNIQIFIWTTVQGLNTTKNRLQKLKEITSVDFLVFDESHIGKYAEKFTELREQFSNVPCLSVSGTAYKQIWEYPENRRFVYSYYEEQLDNLRGVFNPLRPLMELIVLMYDSPEYRKIFGDAIADAMKNIFVLNDEKTEFLYPELVRDFIHRYFGPQRHIKDFKKRLLYGSQHLLISLPSITACHLFAEMVEQYYIPFVVTSDTNRESKDITDFLEKNKEAKTITITCEANVLGVTQELWDTIILCKEGSSREFWTQFVFRGGSGDKNWKVIDMCPERALECLHEDYVTNAERNPEIRQRILREFVAISEFEDGLKPLSQEKIYEILSTDITSATRLISGLIDKIDDDKLKDFEIDLNIKSSKDCQNKKVVNQNDTNGKSNETFISNSDGEKDDSSSKNLKNLFEQKKKSLKAITDSIPLVIFWELKNGNQINSIDSVINSEYYDKITEDTMGYLRQAIDQGLVDPQNILYRIVDVTAWISTSMNIDETMTLYKLSISKNGNRNIPVEFLEEIFV